MAEFSLGDLKRAAVNKGQKIGLEVLQMRASDDNDYGKFVGLLEQALDHIILSLIAQKNILQKASEDQITSAICTPLNLIGFFATHDTNQGGHVDILVDGPMDMKWLGEAKKYSGDYGKLMSGFLQLTGRYSPGMPGQNAGGVLFYTFEPNALGLMENWAAYLPQVVKDISVAPIEGLNFRSTHKHEGTGLDVFVRHTPVPLHHDPPDRKPISRRRR